MATWGQQKQAGPQHWHIITLNLGNTCLPAHRRCWGYWWQIDTCEKLNKFFSTLNCYCYGDATTVAVALHVCIVFIPDDIYNASYQCRLVVKMAKLLVNPTCSTFSRCEAWLAFIRNDVLYIYSPILIFIYLYEQAENNKSNDCNGRAYPLKDKTLLNINLKKIVGRVCLLPLTHKEISWLWVNNKFTMVHLRCTEAPGDWHSYIFTFCCYRLQSLFHNNMFKWLISTFRNGSSLSDRKRVGAKSEL